MRLDIYHACESRLAVCITVHCDPHHKVKGGVKDVTFITPRNTLARRPPSFSQTLRHVSAESSLIKNLQVVAQSDTRDSL
jgi:hypothetical protein